MTDEQFDATLARLGYGLAGADQYAADVCAIIAERNALLAEVARLQGENDRLRNENAAAHTYLVFDAVPVVFAELRADAKRLDWLAEHGDELARRDDGRWNVLPYREAFSDLRAAIDAAMAQEAPCR